MYEATANESYNSIYIFFLYKIRMILLWAIELFKKPFKCVILSIFVSNNWESNRVIYCRPCSSQMISSILPKLGVINSISFKVVKYFTWKHAFYVSDNKVISLFWLGTREDIECMRWIDLTNSCNDNFTIYPYTGKGIILITHC